MLIVFLLVLQQFDGADSLLQTERLHLQNLKKSLEMELRQIQHHLVVLDGIRRRLDDVIRERSRVNALFTHASPAAANRNSYRVLSDGDGAGSEGLSVEPLGPYTPEAQAALEVARDAIERTKVLRKEAARLQLRVDDVQKCAIQTANEGLAAKLTETANLKVRLPLPLLPPLQPLLSSQLSPMLSLNPPLTLQQSTLLHRFFHYCCCFCHS